MALEIGGAIFQEIRRGTKERGWNVLYYKKRTQFAYFGPAQFLLTSLDQVMVGSGFPDATHFSSTFLPFFTT